MEGVRFVLQRQHWDAITDDECRMVLRKMHLLVESFLQGRPVADRMAEEGIFVKLRVQEIPEHEQMNKALVEFVDEKGKGALRSFMDALLKTEQLRLYDILLNELQKSAATVFPCHAQSPRIGAQPDEPGSSSGLQPMLASKSAIQLHLTTDDQHLVMCPVCERAMADPVLLPCLHTCCRSCVVRGEQGHTADDSKAAFGRRSSPIDSAKRGATDSEPGTHTGPLHISDAEFDGSSADELHSYHVQKEQLPQAVDDGSLDARSTVLSVVAGGDLQAVSAAAETAAEMLTGCSEQPVYCPVCRESLPESGGLANRLVTKRVAQLVERIAGAMCRRCLDRGYDNVDGNVRCLNCSMFMCESCAADHNSFLKNHTFITSEAYFGGCGEGSTGGEGDAKNLGSRPDALCPAIHRPPVPCTVHSNSMDMYCGDCEMLICSDYLKRKCLLKGHRSVEPLEVHAARARQDIGKLVSDLWPLPLHDGKEAGTSAGNRTAVAALSTEDELRVALLQLKRSLVKPLSLGKQDLFEAVENAFEAAQDQVIDYCTRLEHQARRAEVRFGGAIAYCRQLIRMGDDVCIAEQHAAVMACLRRLLGETASSGSGSDHDDGKVGGSDTDELGARAICNNYLIIERRPLTDVGRAIIADLIGQPKAVAADRPLPLLSVLAMASDADAQLVREKKDDEPVKEKGADEKDYEQVTAGDRNRAPSPTVDAADGGADKVEMPTGHSEELDLDGIVGQLRERLAAAEDQSNELRVQLEQAEARAAQLDIDLQASRATVRRLDQELEALRQAKSEVDCDLKTLQLDSAKAAAESSEYRSTVAAAERVKFGPLLQPRASDLASRGLGTRTWPPAGQAVRVGGRLQPPKLVPALHGRGSPYAGSLPPARPPEPTSFYQPLPGTAYAAAYPGHPRSLLLWTPVVSITAPSDSVDVPVSQCDVEEAGYVVSSSPINNESVGSPPKSPSAASGQVVLVTDRSSYLPRRLEIRWPSSNGDAKFGLALKLLWTERLYVKCFDVAVTRNGIAAIATDKGLHLYDCAGHRQLLQVGVDQSYRCVAAVPDASDAQLGKSVQFGSTIFVAGNKSAKTLELLVFSFSGPSGRCDVATVLLKDNLPWCVAVDGEGCTAAVSSGRFVRTLLLGGSCENAVPFSIGYTVSALAYGCQALIVGSSEKKDGRYALEARDASNINRQLWTQWFDQAVTGLQCDRYSHCYVLLARSRALHIISEADGVHCAEVALGSQLPLAAIDRNCQWLMLLQGDNTLALFEVHDVEGHAEKS